MKKLLAFLIGTGLLVSSCTKQAYEGAVVGGAAGSAVGAILDEENPWRGAFIGGVIGAVVTGTIVDISTRAVQESVYYGRPIEYRCYKRCRENIVIRAVPGKRVGRCRWVKVYYYKNGRVIKVKRKKVCRHRHRHRYY